MFYNWIYAFRLKTLPLSLSGLILSTFIFIWSSFTSIFLQILSNIATDNITIQSGILSKKKIKLVVYHFFQI
ncbi:MAG: hypothetical protein ACKA33_00705 [Candidatus Karelsulcia muelleri]